MKVLLIGNYIEPPFSEGVVNTVLNWSKALYRIGEDPTILSLSSKYSGYHKFFGINFEYVKTARPRFQDSLIDVFSIQRETMKKLDFTVMHFASTMDGVSAIPIMAFLKLKKQKTVNSYHANCLANSTYLLRHLMFNATTVPSKRLLSNFSRQCNSLQKLSFLPPCVDENHFCPRDKFKVREMLGLQKDAFIIFTVGHFKRGRLLTQLIQVVTELANQGKNVQLLIGWTGHGESDYINEIFSVAAKNRIIKIILPTNKINLYYNAADIYALTVGSSYVVETPLSLLEAASSGTPSVAFNINASSEIIKECVNGYIVKDNSFVELKLKLKEITNNPFVLEELSRNARRLFLDTYSFEKIGRQLSALYKEVLI